jgi:transposase InsO family protein
VWSYDFVRDRLANHRAVRLLCVLDARMRECLAIEVARSLTSRDVILTLSRLIHLYGKPQFIRSDNGTEFTAADALAALPASWAAFIPSGKP